MKLQSVYPVIMSDQVATLCDFYKTHFTFESVFESEWYVSLQCSASEAGSPATSLATGHAPQVFELAILDPAHETVPPGYGLATQGMILNIEVEDATAEYTRLIQREKLPEVIPLRDEAFGQRHFITHDPDGNLIDIIETIPPKDTFVEAVRQESNDGTR